MPTTCQWAFTGEALAWYAGVPLRDYFLDADAACAVITRGPLIVRERFGLEIRAGLMGLSYSSLLALGADVVFMDNGNPMISPCVDDLEAFLARAPRHPFDHPLVRQQLDLWRAVHTRLGGELAPAFGNEAPFTAAVLLRGPEFLIDLVEQPEAARGFLDRLTDNWLACHRAVCELTGRPATGQGVGLADDFSGFLPPAAFRELVLPTYDRIYRETEASYRWLHSELLRPEHLPLLGEVGIDYFDPNVDQYLTVDDLRERLPAGTDWNWRVIASHLNFHTPAEVVAEYEEGVRGGAPSILVDIMPEVPDENIHAIIEVAKRYA